MEFFNESAKDIPGLEFIFEYVESMVTFHILFGIDKNYTLQVLLLTEILLCNKKRDTQICYKSCRIFP